MYVHNSAFIQEAVMGKTEKIMDWDHDCVHRDFAEEANDILVDLWNRRTFDRMPKVKERVAKLLGRGKYRGK